MTDGRRQRSIDSRARIVAAMLQLVQAGDVSPSAEQVAARAGVGLRSVFRHFKDMDALYREMADVVEAEIRSAFDRPFEAADWRERVIEIVRRRSVVFERIAPFQRAAEANRHRSGFLEAGRSRMATTFRLALLRQLTAEVAADTLRLEGLDALLSYEMWSRLRGEQALSVERARQVVEAAVRRMIG